MEDIHHMKRVKVAELLHKTLHELHDLQTKYEKMHKEKLQLEWDYMLAQSHIGTLLAINNKYHAHHVRYSTFHEDYMSDPHNGRLQKEI